MQNNCIIQESRFMQKLFLRKAFTVWHRVTPKTLFVSQLHLRFFEEYENKLNEQKNTL